jgi:hypothetical protein
MYLQFNKVIENVNVIISSYEKTDEEIIAEGGSKIDNMGPLQIDPT